MSGDATPNLNLLYLDPYQAQPEVKVNDAWNKIDEAIGAGLEVNTLGASPPGVATEVRKLTFEGAALTAESDSGVVVTIDDAGVVKEASWTNALGAISVPINDVIRYSGADRRIKECVVLTQGGTGSCTIEIWKSNLGAHFPPVSGDDITGGANVVISSGTTHQDSTLSGWSTLIGKDDVFLFKLTACSTFTNVTISLRLG
jgi:hypothetical protein